MLRIAHVVMPRQARSAENMRYVAHTRLVKKGFRRIVSAVAGAAIGLINGFFGGGGGMLCVPALKKLCQKPVKKAHATAIFVILPVSAASAAVYAAGGSFTLSQGVPAALGVVAGGIAGAVLLSRLNNRVIRLVFAFVMIAAGVRMMF